MPDKSNAQEPRGPEGEPRPKEGKSPLQHGMNAGRNGERPRNPFADVHPDGEESRKGLAPARGAADEPYWEQDEFPAPYDEEEAEEPRDYMPIRGRRDGKLGCLGGFMYAAFVISLSVILACMAWLAASDVLALNKKELTATVTIPKSVFHPEEVDVEDKDGNVIGKKTVDVADIDYVADTLKASGIIEYKFLFKLYSQISHAARQIDPGTYELSTDYDYRALVKKMQVGSDSQLETTVTFPEGYTLEQIFQKLEDNDICSKEDLYEAAANYAYSYRFLEGVETGDAKRLEGFLFPDTYNFYQGMQASSAINKFLSNLHYKLTAEMWNTMEKRKMTFKEVVTVASMIEREAANDEERPVIASVIYNRLKAEMPLCIDATIQYILPEHVPYITQEHTQIDSPYNTYLHPGLPPGPICNPGLASIKAALSPAATNYYYYALNMETGRHEFFKTAREHEAFVATQDYSGLAEAG